MRKKNVIYGTKPANLDSFGAIYGIYKQVSGNFTKMAN